MNQLRSILKGGLVLLLGTAAACTAPPLEQTKDSPTDGREVVTDPPEALCCPVDIAGARPLSPRQYALTIKAVFGEAVSKVIVPLPTSGWRGFDTDLSSLNSDFSTIEAASTNASVIAKQLTGSGAAGILPCDVRAAQNASDCAARTIETLGPLLLRRPVADHDRATLLALFERTRTKDGDVLGIENVVRTLLMSPTFLFHIERGKQPATGTNGSVLAPHELAHRLAYVLWGTPADAALLDRALKGDLDTTAGIRSQVEMMLKDPRSRSGIQDFYAQWLGLNHVLTRSKDEKTFPRWNAAVAAEAFEESMQFVDDNFFVEGGNLDHLFTSRTAVIGPKLAEIYGVRGELGKLELPINERAGILTRVAFLAGGSGAATTHPSYRGSTMINGLLCETLPLPPNSINAIPPMLGAAPMTKRQKIEMTVKNAQCASCHGLIDPFGFAFESYDAIGVHRSTENGLPIDASGNIELMGVTGSWKNAIELSAWLPTQALFRTCVASQFWRFAASHESDVKTNSCTIERITKLLNRKGGGLRDLVVETLADQDFRKVADGVGANTGDKGVRGLPEGKSALETSLLVAARRFEDEAIGMPMESEKQLKRWSEAFFDLAKREAASRF